MNLEQLLSILWNRKNLILITIGVTFSIAFAISLILPKQYSSSATVMVDQRNVDSITGLTVAVQLLPSYMSAQTDIVNSHTVARKVVEKLRLAENEKLKQDFLDEKLTNVDINDWLAEIFKKKLTAKASREGNIIDISYASGDPVFAAIITNTFVDAYIETSVDLRVQPAKITADWFDAQLIDLRQKLEAARHKLSTYQQQHGIVLGTEQKIDFENERLLDLSRELVASQSKTGEMQSKRDVIKNNGAGWSDSMQEVLSSTLINSLKSDLANKEANLAFLNKKINKNHPQYQQAEAEINSLKNRINLETAKIQASMSNGLSTAKQKDVIINKAVEDQKNKILEMKKQLDEIDVLNHEVDTAQKIYDIAMQQAVKMRMSSEINHTEISILNRAIPAEKASSPKIVMNALMGIFLGSLFGSGAAIFRELRDRRIRSVNDLEVILELPVLGVITL